jgi:uncharacterized membrane protein YkoI
MNIRTLILAGLLALASLPAHAQTRETDQPEDFIELLDEPPVRRRAVEEFDVAQDTQAAIPPSEAAAIAQDTVPGAKVLKVKLLPSGVYAVTLRVKGSVIRVMVSSEDGSIQ